MQNILQLQTLFIRKSLSLGLAESCTGGSIAQSITSIDGASQYFMGSIVAYAVAVKESILKVDQNAIEKYGVVSEEVAVAMADGARSALKCNIALSVTGYAGTVDNESLVKPGTVCMAIIDSQSNIQAETLRFYGDRVTIIQRTVNHAIQQLIHFAQAD